MFVGKGHQDEAKTTLPLCVLCVKEVAWVDEIRHDRLQQLTG